MKNVVSTLKPTSWSTLSSFGEYSLTSLKNSHSIKTATFSSGVGISGDLQTLYYAEVTEDLRVSLGGGNTEEGEDIELVEMSIKEVEDYLSQSTVSSPGGFLFALQWFLANKAPQYR